MGMNTKVLESILEAVNVTGDELLDELMDIEAAMPAAVDLAPVGQAIGEGLGSVVQVLEDIRDAMPVAPVPPEENTLRTVLLSYIGYSGRVLIRAGTPAREILLPIIAVGDNYVKLGNSWSGSYLYIPFSSINEVETD